MGTLQDAMKSSGIVTEEQLQKVEQEKADEQRRREEERRRQEVERREKAMGAPLPDFFRAAILANEAQIEKYIDRTEKEMGQLSRKLHGMLKQLNHFDALILLGSTLTLYRMYRDFADLKDESARQKNMKEARRRALQPLWATLERQLKPDKRRKHYGRIRP